MNKNYRYSSNWEIFLFMLTMLWINKYRLLIDYTFGNGSSRVRQLSNVK